MSNQASSSSPACVVREAQPDKGWITATGDDFINPAHVYHHSIADRTIDKQAIEKYRIKLFDGTWTDWYYPGVNDVEPLDKIDKPLNATEEQMKRWHTIWNANSTLGGRRRWTSFDDHKHEVCFYADFTSAISKDVDCQWRYPQGVAWLTAQGQDFVTPEASYLHSISDLLLDQRRIARYRINHQNTDSGGRISRYFFPGVNDHRVRKSHRDADNATFNDQTKNAGRRQWTFFATKEHYVCYFQNQFGPKLSPDFGPNSGANPTVAALAAKVREEKTKFLGQIEEQAAGMEYTPNAGKLEISNKQLSTSKVKDIEYTSPVPAGDTPYMAIVNDLLASTTQLVLNSQEVLSRTGKLVAAGGAEVLAKNPELQHFVSNSQEMLAKSGQHMLRQGEEMLLTANQQIDNYPQLRHAKQTLGHYVGTRTETTLWIVVIACGLVLLCWEVCSCLGLCGCGDSNNSSSSSSSFCRGRGHEHADEDADAPPSPKQSGSKDSTSTDEEDQCPSLSSDRGGATTRRRHHKATTNGLD